MKRLKQFFLRIPSTGISNRKICALPSGFCGQQDFGWPWRETIDLARERAVVEAQVVKAFGHPCRMDTTEPGVLRLESAHRGTTSGNAAAVRAAATLWGGGWESVELRAAGKLKRYAPDGTRVSSRPASRFQPNAPTKETPKR